MDRGDPARCDLGRCGRADRPGAVAVQAQHLDSRSRNLFELHLGVLLAGVGRGSPPETGPHDSEADQRRDEQFRVGQRLPLIHDTQDDEPKES